MSDKEILDVLLKFGDNLSDGWIIMDVFRSLGWVIILGLGWLVDSLENVTDSILGLKTFFADSDISGLVQMLKPLSVILMAFSLLYTGYLLIFQKKIDREGIIINVFLALVVIALLGSGMNKADHFTNDAVTALNGKEEGSLADTIIKDGIIDVALYDLQEWKKPDINPINQIPKENIRDIDINSYLTDGTKLTKDKELSNNGVDILSKKLDTLGDGSHGLQDLDDGNFITDITKEYYYRYTVHWFTIMVTLAITAFTLLTIAIKLAKLFFELAFNYVLATIIAPADIHSGQKTKQIIQNILNIFLVTIMIFLSMKIYIIGTVFIDDKLDGLPYLIALFAFSLAVIDGPNIVERLFGIDAGLKSGWGALAGAYAGSKGLSHGVKGLSSAGKSAALKGIGGAAGVAGMAQGLRKSEDKRQEKSNETSKNNPNGKGDNQNKDVNKEKNQNGETDQGKGSEELNAGREEVASSLEHEMNHQEQQKNDQAKGGNLPPGLYQEMAANGKQGSKELQSNSNMSKNDQNKSGAVNNTPSSSSSNSMSGNVAKQVSHASQGSGGSYSSGSNTSVFGSENTGSIRTEVVNDSPGGQVSTVSPQSSAPSYGGSDHVMESQPISRGGSLSDTRDLTPVSSIGPTSSSPTNERRTTESVRETRHVGQAMSDKVKSNRSFQKVQQSYQIGQNTGESVRKKIASYRKNK
ncbi:pLS20_p028 family conjugation system transmembrane protein [Fictibacillus sp. S7]|uniref:pLS20_p028 family conjugation system transmembrane protein n=1 Tax=Fictibacillus sp. S7 TaxID=2212476 RepID=UPI0010138352|nr:hypothetical protein [Fictibacillus sp. S7]RXZ02129.1 hypothetical protein DMO16_22165 [Fictibacillus sp. S7]